MNGYDKFNHWIPAVKQTILKNFYYYSIDRNFLEIKWKKISRTIYSSQFKISAVKDCLILIRNTHTSLVRKRIWKEFFFFVWKKKKKIQLHKVGFYNRLVYNHPIFALIMEISGLERTSAISSLLAEIRQNPLRFLKWWNFLVCL